MRIAVIGAGGVGGYFGGKLAHAGIDTTFIVRGRTLAALRANGLRVDSVRGDFTVPAVQATDDPSTVGQVDAVLIAVKAWQIPEAARALLPLLGPDTVVVPLENGLEGPAQLAATVGREHILGGFCSIVSYIVEPGHIRHTAAEPLVAFGELDHTRSPRVERLRAAFERARVDALTPADIQSAMWTKFLFIAPMSGLGALTRVPIGVWRSMPETRALAVAALHELLALAAARGVTFTDDTIDLTLARYDNLPPEATASLQRDVMEGKPSELDAQIGAVTRMGRESGVPTPVHDVIYAALLPQERRARGL